MSSLLKVILAIVACVCFLQYVEMARTRRDTPVSEAGSNDVGATLQHALDDIVSKLKSSLNEDTIKKLTDTLQNAVDEGTKAVSGVASKVGEALNNAGNTATAAAH